MMSGEEGGGGNNNSTTDGAVAGAGAGVQASSSGSRCQDCGNQAKRDCEHLRCRTCCKSRGFQCPTHVKSTWVPVACRRPRLYQHHHIIPQPDHHHIGLHHPHGPNPKRYRDHNHPPPQLGLEEGENVLPLPGEVSFPAVFRCVRVSSMDNVVDQYAYQTSVIIGGHVFTGILYDQGSAEREVATGQYVTGGSGSGSAGAGIGIGLLQQHQHQQNQSNYVPAGVGTSSAATGTIPCSYPSPFCAFSATTSHFFHYPNS